MVDQSIGYRTDFMAKSLRAKILFFCILMVSSCIILHPKPWDMINLQFNDPSDSKDSSQPIYMEKPQKICQWYFLNYTPSVWENMWYDNISELQNNVCETLYSAENLNNTILMAKRIAVLQTFGRNKTTDTKKNADDLLSKLFYQQKCFDLRTKTPISIAEISHSIEPLIGLLRDPFTICSRRNSTLISPTLYDGATVQSKRFLLLSISAPFNVHQLQRYVDNFERIQEELESYQGNLLPWMYQRLNFHASEEKAMVRSSQTILFDLGSSYFGGWNGDSTAAAGLWLYEYYKRFNVKFDRIIAFEYSALDQKTAWKQLPDDVFSVYTLINVGVTENGTFNPWRMLRTVARQNDHVVVKLDIDTPTLENALMSQLLADSSIHLLIDELFFEHHVTVNEMVPYWGRPPGTLKDSYILFRRIRQLGIRMHSWP